MWNRAKRDFIQAQEFGWSVIPAGEFGQGDLQKVLSRDEQCGATSSLVRVRNEHCGVFEAGADLLILEGGGTLNGVPIAANDYFHVPPGAPVALRPGPRRTTLFMGSFAAPRMAPGPGDDLLGEVQHVSFLGSSWEPAAWNDDGVPLELGVMIKPLRRDERGERYLSAMTPGWSSALEEMHPNGFEEVFRIHGDLVHGKRGVMGPGAYSYRTPGSWHAPMMTSRGTLTLCRTSEVLETTYRKPAKESWQALYDAVYSGSTSPACE